MLAQKRILKTLFYIYKQQEAVRRGERKAPLTRSELIHYYKKTYHKSRATADRDVQILEQFDLVSLAWIKLPDEEKTELEVYVVNRQPFPEPPSLTFVTKENKMSLHPSKRYRKTRIEKQIEQEKKQAKRALGFSS